MNQQAVQDHASPYKNVLILADKDTHQERFGSGQKSAFQLVKHISPGLINFQEVQKNRGLSFQSGCDSEIMVSPPPERDPKYSDQEKNRNQECDTPQLGSKFQEPQFFEKPSQYFQKNHGCDSLDFRANLFNDHQEAIHNDRTHYTNVAQLHSPDSDNGVKRPEFLGHDEEKHDDEEMTEDLPEEAAVIRSLQSRTFAGIPKEWHQIIKQKNPTTQRIKLSFKCRFPGCATFKKSCNLRDHFRKHTGARPFNCPECKKTFTQSGNLGRHLKNVHGLTRDVLKEDY